MWKKKNQILSLNKVKIKKIHLAQKPTEQELKSCAHGLSCPKTEKHRWEAGNEAEPCA
jgi:hypothetical protein